MEQIGQILAEWSPIIRNEIGELINAKHYTEALRLLREYPAESAEVARLVWRCHAERGFHQDALNTISRIARQDAHLRLLAARSSLSLHRWEHAEGYARASFDASPSAGAADVLVAVLTRGKSPYQLDEGLRETIAALLHSAVRLSDASEATYTWFLDCKAAAYATEGENVECIQLLRGAVAAFPDSVELRERLAVYLDSETDAQEILDILTPILGTDASARAHRLAYEALAALGNIRAAIVQLQELGDDSSEDQFKRALLKAETYLNAGIFGEAEIAYGAIREDAPPELYFHSLMGGTVLAVRLGDTNKALRLFAEATEMYFDGEQFGSHLIHHLYYFEVLLPSRLAEACRLIRMNREVTDSLPPSAQGGLFYFEYAEGEEMGRPQAEKLSDAYAAYPHRKMQGDLARELGKARKITESVRHHLSHALWLSEHSDDSAPGTYYGDSLKPTRRAGIAMHRIFKAFLRTHRNDDNLGKVFWPFYRSFLRRVHFDASRYATIVATLQSMDIKGHGTPADWWDFACAAQEAGKLSEAEAAYEEYLRQEPADSARTYECALVKQKLGKLEGALEYCEKTLSLQPDHAQAAELLVILADRTQKERERIVQETKQGREEESRRATLTLTAPDRWPLLDPYKRQLLATLSVIGGFTDWAELAMISGIGEKFLKGHWRKLLDLGMLIERTDGSVVVNDLLLPLIKPERSHSLVTKIIRADERIAFKPIFNSQLESTVYNILVRLFPNQLVCPNMSLQTVFQYDRMKELLNHEEFGYYLRSQVDICIISTASYLPIICIEVDSHYHDGAAQTARDEMKDLIFTKGGVPLLRTRPYGRPTEQDIKEHLSNQFREYGKELRQTEEQAGRHVSVLIEIDFEAFGRESDK